MTRKKCVELTFKTKYEINDDCYIDHENQKCVSSTYTLRIESGEELFNFLSSALVTNFPNNSTEIAIYYQTIWDNLSPTSTNFKECKSFRELDINSTVVDDGFTICSCMRLIPRKSYKCLCEGDCCETKKCNC